MVASLVHAATGARVRGPAPSVRVDRRRRQITIQVPHRDWNPKRRTVRLAAGVGLWDSSAQRYLLPGATADATHPGGAGTAAHPAAFFNVAFRTREPSPSVTAGSQAVTDAAWWRDRAQGTALAANDISSLFANVNFSKLAKKVRDDSQIPRTGGIDRILASHFEPAQGANFSSECGFGGAFNPASCVPEYQGRLQPYAIFVPRGAAPGGGYGMTLQLHSLSANYNQYLSSRNQSQFAQRPKPSIVITPEARGPDQFYEGLGAADVFEVWADVARHYALNRRQPRLLGLRLDAAQQRADGVQERAGGHDRRRLARVRCRRPGRVGLGAGRGHAHRRPPRPAALCADLDVLGPDPTHSLARRDRYPGQEHLDRLDQRPARAR